MISEIICVGTSYTEGGGLYDPIVKEYYKKQNIIYDKQSEVAWPSHLNKLSNINIIYYYILNHLNSVEQVNKVNIN